MLALGYESAEELLSAPLAELLSRGEMFTPEGDPFPVEQLPGRRVLMGEEPEPVLVRFRDRSDGAMHWARVKARPVPDRDGGVRLAINLIEDITELKQVEQSQRFLAEASRVLASSLDYEQTLATMISVMLVPMRVRDRVLGAISFVSAESGRRPPALHRRGHRGLRPRAGLDPRGAPRRVARRGGRLGPGDRRPRRRRGAGGARGAAP